MRALAILWVTSTAGFRPVPSSIWHSSSAHRSAVHCRTDEAATFNPAVVLADIRQQITEQERLIQECLEDEGCILEEIRAQEHRDLAPVDAVQECLDDDECSLSVVLEQIESKHGEPLSKVEHDCLLEEDCILLDPPLSQAVQDCHGDRECILKAVGEFETCQEMIRSLAKGELDEYVQSLRDDIHERERVLEVLHNQRKSMVAMLWDDRKSDVDGKFDI